MPFSNAEQMSPIIAEIRHLRPKSVLDVGCGLGLYGFLCRIYLDLYDDVNFYDKLIDKGRKKWTVAIDAIEGFADYVPFIPGWVYDDIKVGNALDILPEIESGKYDLVLSLAILEHLTKDEGMIFLKELKRVGQKIILSVPKEWKEQTVPDNPFETHKSHWTYSGLRDFGFNKFLPHWGAWIAVYDPDLEGIVQGGRAVNPDESTKEREPSRRTLNDATQVKNRDQGIETSIKRLDDKLNLVLNVQNVILERLNFSVRFKSLRARLRRLLTGKG
jgi:SAM-dependent methyltransferase